MNKVFGNVLVKETGQGIRNVVVVVFDVDAGVATGSTTAPGAVPPASIAGDRLGSALTDAKGYFELAFDETAFAAGDPERRPDLILGVFAPEDPRSPGDPTPPPMAQRLLVFSNEPRRDAGRTEAYVLRVPLELLARHDIHVPGPPDRGDPAVLATQLLNVHAAKDQLSALVRQGLVSSRRARLQRHREIKKASRTFVAKLSGVPKFLAGKPTLALAKSDVGQAQRAGMERGLTVLGTMVESRPMVIDVTEDDLITAGFSSGELAQTIELTHEQVCHMLARRRGGVALERILDLVEARKSEADAARRLEHATNGQVQQPPPGEVDEDEAYAPVGMDAVRTGVLAQLNDLTTSAPAPAASIEELSARLTGFSLPPGPADVTSFHDFHELQIAFEHVWTEAFDQTLKERVQDVYEQTVRLHDEFGLQIDPLNELVEIDDLFDFLATTAGQAEALNEECPLPPLYTLPEVSERWSLFSDAQRARLTENVEDRRQIGLQAGAALERMTPEEWEAAKELYLAKDLPLMAEQRAIAAQPAGGAARLTRLLSETRTRLTEPYAFHYFAPNSVNFGILLTYRQKWQPLTYQVGDLVGTIPLAPGESRKMTTKTVIKRSRAQKELEKALSSRSGESTMTQRAEAEITAKASTTTNFKNTAQGSFSFGIGSLEASAEFVLNQAQESASAKKSFREAVIKAAEEYKQERALEVETTQEVTSETTTSGEISNPNNEMTVTYLLYELERQYRISERIHRVLPVVLVAQDVPAPHEITESWLLAQDWILRRVLLDDSLQGALDLLRESFAGDELSVTIKKQNWETQKRIVEKLETTVTDLLAQRDAFRNQLLNTEQSRALAQAAEDAEGFLVDFHEALTADVGAAAVGDLEAQVKRIEHTLEFLQETLGEAQQKLTAAREALDSATKEYTGALETQTNRRVAIDQLRVHVKQNIIYYMQAIWDHEPPDQRFFRLYYQEVNLPEAPTDICSLRRATDEELALGVETIVRDGNYYVIENCGAPELPDPEHPNTKKLVEIANLERPLGYKGNYIIFPLKTCVYLTEFMMKQFVDGYFGVRDPDEAGNYTSDELIAYLEAIWNDPTVTLSDDDREALQGLVLKRIREPRRDSDIVIVPSGQIYMEALLGNHPLLEPFKQIHRAYDVGKARAELRRAELDNLRRAARLLQDTPDFEDPDIDKRVVIEGAAASVIADNS